MTLDKLHLAGFLVLAGCLGTNTGTDSGDTSSNNNNTGTDADDDGYDSDEDCDDNDADVNPGVDEDCEDGADNNCNDDVDMDDSDCTGGGGDTGTAYLVWAGSMKDNGDSVDVTYGIASLTINGVWPCALNGSHSGGGEAPPSCPDCAFAYGTTYVGGEVVGDYCDSFLTDTLFTYYTTDDVWWAAGGSDGLLGWGFSDLYVYEYGGSTYDLENAVFMYYSGYGWILRHYDYPANGYETVDESADPITFMSYLTDSSGNPSYYYFYY